MNSLSKVVVSHHELTAIVKDIMGQDLLRSEELTDGWFNTIYALETKTSRLVLKIAPPTCCSILTYEEGIMDTEVKTLQLLHGHGIPTPRVHAYQTKTGTLEQASFFMDWLPGLSLGKYKASLGSNDPTTIVSLDKAMGDLQGRIHGIPCPPSQGFGPMAWGPNAPKRWSEAVVALVTRLLDDAREVGTNLPMTYGRIMGIFHENSDVLDTCDIPRLVLWDLHDGNVLVNGTELSGVIDCDRALWGDPLMDSWFRHLWGRPGDDFLNAWLACMEPCLLGSRFATMDLEEVRLNPILKTRVLLYDLYLALVMRIESDFRGYTNKHIAWTNGLLDQALRALGVNGD